MRGHIDNSVEDYRRVVRERLFSRAEPERR
jgi:hypothetical protein